VRTDGQRRVKHPSLPPVLTTAHNGAADGWEVSVAGSRLKRWGIGGAVGLGLGWALLQATPWLSAGTPAHAQDKQSVLGPGLYVYQTRVKHASCGDAEPDGYVLSFFAAIDGVPGSTSMTMQLVNTAHFKDWTLTIRGTQVTGQSKIGKAPDGPETHFDVVREGDRFKGTGERSYNGSVGGKAQRCTVSYDALLKRLDV
jgi:hypothetical protein